MAKQISLQREPLERNKEFTRQLGELEISNGRYLFEKIDHSSSALRQEDSQMTLYKFLSLMDTSFIVLQDDPDFGIGIRFNVSMVYDSSDSARIERFLGYNCTHTNENLGKIKGLYSRVYRKELDF